MTNETKDGARESSDVQREVHPKPRPWTTGGVFFPGSPQESMSVYSARPAGCQGGAQQIAYGLTVADAHLIAAAPDLLAALKLCEARLRAVDDLDVEARALARSAIARAEGRS